MALLASGLRGINEHFWKLEPPCKVHCDDYNSKLELALSTQDANTNVVWFGQLTTKHSANRMTNLCLIEIKHEVIFWYFYSALIVL